MSPTYGEVRRSFRQQTAALLVALTLTFSWAVSRPPATGASQLSLGAVVAAVSRAALTGVSDVSRAAVSASQVVAHAVASVAEQSQTRRTRRALTVLGAATLGLVGGARRASAASSSGADPAISPASVSTLAGSGTGATVDGTGAGASFNSLNGVVVVGGFAYVGSSGSIRKVDVSSGAVTTLAGDATATGCTDSATASAVRFGGILDLATDGTSLYATQADCAGGFTVLIRKVTIATGATTTLTTAPSGFSYSGYLTYSGGYLFMSGASVLKVDVSTVPDTSSAFATLGDIGHGIVGDGTSLWVSIGSTTSAIKQVSISTGTVSTFVSASDVSFISNAVEAAGSSLYVVVKSAVLRRYNESTGSYTDIAGVDPNLGAGDMVAEPAFAEGTGTDAWFSNTVTGIGSDGTNLYVADSGNFRLRKAAAGTAWTAGQPASYSTTVGLPASAELRTIAGSGSPTNVNGTGTGASLTPTGVVVVGGYGYVATDTAIRKINLSTGVVTTLAGDLTTSGCTDSADPSQVRFRGILDLVTDGHFLYDVTSNCTSAGAIRRTSIATGATSTVAAVGSDLHTTIGPDGALYFSDNSTNIWRLDPITGVISSTPVAGFTDWITGLTADSNYLWVNASNNGGSTHSALYRVTTGGTVTTVSSHPSDAQLALYQTASAGDYLYGFSGATLEQLRKSDGSLRGIVGGTAGFADGVGTGAQLQTNAVGLTSDGTSLWMSDYGNYRFRKIGPVAATPDPSACSCGKRETRYPIDVASGGYYTSFTDVAIAGRSPELNATRTYVAQEASYDGPFGYGWLSSYDMHLEFGSLTGPSPVEVVQENGASISYSWNGTSYVGPSSDFATLVHNSGGTWTFTRRSQEQFVFDSTGLLIQEIARNGFAGSPGPTVAAAYTTTLAYSSGRLSTVTDAAGRTLTFSYGTNGKISGIADSTGRSVAYSYDGADNLTDVTDVASGNTHFTYYSDHTMHTVRDPRGNTVETMTYDSSGRVLTQTDALSRVTAFDYTTVPGSTIVTDPKGNEVLDTFTNGLVTSETKGYGTASAETWTYTYDPSTSGVATVTDPNSHVTTDTWDPSGNPLTVKDALTHTTTYTYNAFGEPLTIQDALSQTTTNTYNSAGNLTSTSTPWLEQPGQYQTTTYTYGDSAHPGDVTSITDPRTKVTNFTYDSSTGDLVSVTTPTGDETTFTYDSAGRRLTMVSPEGNKVGGTPSAHTTTYVPDAFGDVTSVTDQLSHQTQYVYDADRNLYQTIDPLLQSTTNGYDAANQLTSITRPDTSVLHNSYWPDGSLETQTDGAGNVTTYTYDPLGQLSTTSDPKSRVTTNSYDPAGNLHTVLDAESRTTTYTYDNGDRLTGIAYSHGTPPNVSYTYDADNQRATMVDGTGTTTYTVDSLHRMTSTTDGSLQTMSYGYDLDNNLTSITYPGPSHIVTRAYDDSSRLHTITDWLSHVTTYNYDHDANLTTQTYPNTTVATYTPDAADRLTNISDTKSGTPFATFAYSRNANDLLSGVTASGIGSNETYGYSSLNQLNSVNGSSYTFDSADNLTATPNGTKLAYDSANQLCWTATSTASCASPPAGATTYTYGNDGERTAMTPPTGNPTINYAYDEENRLTDVRSAGYRTAVLASNPIAYWRLGDSSGTSASDSSGNAHPGATTNVTWGAASGITTDANTAATFNGTTSSIDVASPNGLKVGQASTFTADAWVKGSATAGRYFIDEGASGSTTPYWGLATDSTTGNKALFIVRDNSGNQAIVNGTKTVMDGTWHYVVGVRDATNTLRLYVDGVADGTASASAVGNPTLSATAVGVLKRNGAFSNYFAGSIDEAALYPSALSAATINNHYRAAQSNYAGTATANAPSAYWRLGETSGTTAADSSTGAHTGTYTGGFTLNVTGALTSDTNKAVTFNGTTGYVVAAGSGVQAGQSSTFSVEAWFKSTSTANNWVIAEGSTTSNNPVDGIATAVSGTKAQFFVRDNAGVTASVNSATTINDGTWHHLVGVRTSNSYTIYVDGKADGATTVTSPALGPITLNTTAVGALKRATVAGFITGSIDEAAYYPTALDAATIARHFYNGTHSSPTVASYTYNGDGTRTAKNVDGTATPFTWDTAEGLPLLASDGTTQYIYGPGGAPLEQITGSTPVYYHQDQQKSTRALTDQTGNVLATYTTDPLGNPNATSGTTQTSLRYDGEYRDNETGFSYLRARYYDPATAQFLSRDPAAPLTRSAYGYALGDPTNRTDPSGLDASDSAAGVADAVDKLQQALDFVTSDNLVGYFVDAFVTGLDPTSAEAADLTKIAKGLSKAQQYLNKFDENVVCISDPSTEQNTSYGCDAAHYDIIQAERTLFRTLARNKKVFDSWWDSLPPSAFATTGPSYPATTMSRRWDGQHGSSSGPC